MWQKQTISVSFLLLFLSFLHFLPIRLFLMFLFRRFLPLPFCSLTIWSFDHFLGCRFACSLQDGFDSQIVNVVCGHPNIDHWLDSGVCGLACIIAVPSSWMMVELGKSELVKENKWRCVYTIQMPEQCYVWCWHCYDFHQHKDSQEKVIFQFVSVLLVTNQDKGYRWKNPERRIHTQIKLHQVKKGPKTHTLCSDIS